MSLAKYGIKIKLVIFVILLVNIISAQEPVLKFLEKGSRFRKNVALTIDDGPHLKYLPKILSILKQENIKATFFVVGKMAKKYPKLIKDIYSAGHEIGSHTFNHYNLTTLSNSRIKNEFEDVRETIYKITNKRISLIRPPYGKYNEKVQIIANKLGYTMVLWSLYSNDYGNKSKSKITRKVLKNIKNGDIILVHSGVDATIDALPRIIKDIKNRGYKFITISEMINDKLKHTRLYRIKKEEKK